MKMNGPLEAGRELRGLAAALGAVIALFAPHPVIAQEVETLADFRACGALERDSARLACFDGVLAADREGRDGDASVGSAPVVATVAPEVAVAAAEPAETRVASAPEPESAEIPATSTASVETDEATAATATQSEPPENQSASAAPAQPAQTPLATAERTEVASARGEEGVAAQTTNVTRSRPAETAPASEARAAPERTQAAAATRSEPAEASAYTIVELSTRMPGAARFITDDGQVFVQTSGGSNYRNFPDVPFTATLEDGALGSTFLRLGPRLRVRIRIVE